jgi:hypothetical protein
MATLTIPTAHPFILTVSHDALFRQPRFSQRHDCRRFRLQFPVTELHSNTFAGAKRLSAACCRQLFSFERCDPQQSRPRRGAVRGIAIPRHARVVIASTRAEPIIRLGSTFTV